MWNYIILGQAKCYFCTFETSAWNITALNLLNCFPSLNLFLILIGGTDAHLNYPLTPACFAMFSSSSSSHFSSMHQMCFHEKNNVLLTLPMRIGIPLLSHCSSRYHANNKTPHLDFCHKILPMNVRGHVFLMPPWFGNLL